MLQTVNPGFNSSSRPICTVCMTHDCKAFLMCNIYHLFDFFGLKRCTCHSSMIVEIKKTCRHNLDKICTSLFCFFHSLMKFFYISKTTSHNRPIVSVFMNSKYWCAIINPIFRSQFCCQLRHSIWISAIPYKRDSCFFICLKAFSHCTFVDFFFV